MTAQRPSSNAGSRLAASAGASARTIRRFAHKIAPLTLALALLASATAGNLAVAQGAEDDPTRPGLCLEATATAADGGEWTEVIDAVFTATEQQSDFFPGPTIASIPDPTSSWDPASSPTIKIGIWSGGAGDPGSDATRLEQLAGTDCLAEDAGWTTVISHELLLAGAERILAAARLPDERGETLIPEGSFTEIDVEFHPADQRVRTTLEFEVDIGFGITISGDCWIDDVLSVEGGHVIVSSTADMDTTPFGDRACSKFERFMVAGGAGERAVGLLPASVPLSGGTDLAFVASAVELSDSTISLLGTVERRAR
jgi:hypothetical protein